MNGNELERDDKARWISRYNTTHRKLFNAVHQHHGRTVKGWRNGKPVIVVKAGSEAVNQAGSGQ